MIYLAGDIHGELEIYKITDFFESEALIREFTEEDYLILLGDVGVCWDNGRKDAYVRDILEALPVTILWIDGNHENFDLMDALPVTDWHGGKVQYIGRKIIHLMRGYVYDICGKSFFAFGGGFSIDKMYRREGSGWWQREMPSAEEYARGREWLERRGNQVDYIITHTASREIAMQLVPEIYPGEEELQYYFQELAETVNFERWYFGHWHMDRVLGRYIGIYDEILRIEETGTQK